MHAEPIRGPRLAETVIHETASLREAEIGTCCEISNNVAVEYSSLGDYSYIGAGSTVADARIEKFCAIAASVRIGAPNHPLERPSLHRFTYCPEYYKPGMERDHDFFDHRHSEVVTIGHDVWIGHGVIVLPGITIGNGAVLAAGAVVTHNVAPYTIVGGSPARPIRDRFEAGIAEKLNRIAWWDWPFDLIMERLGDFQSPDIEAFCKQWGSAPAASAEPHE